MRLSGEGGCGIKVGNSISLIEKALVVSAFSIRNSMDWLSECRASVRDPVSKCEKTAKG